MPLNDDERDHEVGEIKVNIIGPLCPFVRARKLGPIRDTIKSTVAATGSIKVKNV